MPDSMFVRFSRVDGDNLNPQVFELVKSYFSSEDNKKYILGIEDDHVDIKPLINDCNCNFIDSIACIEDYLLMYWTSERDFWDIETLCISKNGKWFQIHQNNKKEVLITYLKTYLGLAAVAKTKKDIKNNINKCLKLLEQ